MPRGGVTFGLQAGVQLLSTSVGAEPAAGECGLSSPWPGVSFHLSSSGLCGSSRQRPICEVGFSTSAPPRPVAAALPPQ